MKHAEFEDTKKCNEGHELVKKPGMFYLSEIGIMPGMVCEKCNSLWDSKEWKEALYARSKAK